MAKKKKLNQKPRYDIVELEKEYNAINSRLVQLEKEVDHQLAQLLQGAALAFPVQHRVKGWPSIAEKLQRVPLSLTTLRDLQDLVGFRIVLQFKRDVERVCSLVEKTFKIVDRYDTLERLREDQFGYSSVHFVVEVPAVWLAVPTMAGLANLRAEIQVRTTAQHIWAEASHTLQYKNANAVPLTLKRAIYRISALLETVDLEFERVLVDRDTYKAEVAQSTLITETLNVDVLAQVLDSSWPSANKDADGEAYAELLTDLNAFQVTTGSALQKLISKWRDPALEQDAQLVSQMRKEPDDRARWDRIDAGVFFTHVGLTREALHREFSDFRKYQLEKAERGSVG